MKGSLSARMLNYLRSPKAFRCLSASKFYWLLLFSSTSVFICSSGVVAFAASPEIAQATVGTTIQRPTLRVGSQGDRVSELQAALKLLGFYPGTVDGIYSENTASAVSRFKQAVGLTPDGIVDAVTWQRLFPNEPTVRTTAASANSASNFPTPTQPRANYTPEPRPANPRTATQVPTQAEPRPTNRRPTATQVPTATEPRPTNRRPTATQGQQRRPSSSSANRNTPNITFRQIPGVQYTDEGWPILRPGMRNSEVGKLQQRLKQFGFLDGDIDGDYGPATEEAVKALQKRYGLEADGVAGGATWDILLRRSPQQR